MKPLLVAVLFVILSCEYRPSRDLQYNEVDSLNHRSGDLLKTDKELSYTLAKEALTKSSAIGYEQGVHTAYLNMGIHFLTTNQMDSGYSYISQASQYFKTSDDQKRYALCLYQFGRFYHQVEDQERARKYFQQALNIFLDINDLKYQSFAFNGIGVTLIHQASYVDGLEYLLKSYELKSQLGVPTSIPLNNISIIYLRMSAYEEAMDYALKAVEQSRLEGDSIHLSGSLKGIGNILMKQEKYDSAEMFFVEAFDIAASIDFQPLMTETSFELNRLYAATHRKEKSIVEYKKLLSEYKLSSKLKKHVLINLAYNFMTQEAYDSAIVYASEALTCCRTFDTHSSIEATQILKESFDSLRAPQAALQYANLTIAYKDSLQMKNEAAKFASLRVRMETLEKEMEIERLRNQAEVDRLSKSRLQLFLVSTGLVAVLVVCILVYRSRYKSRVHKLKSHHLKLEIEQRKSELQQQTLHMVRMNHTLSEVDKQIRLLNNGSSTQKISSKIKLDQQLEKDWENFDKYFGGVNNGFFSRLQTQNNKLTQHEQRICSLIKMNLTNREIATILNIEQKSAKMAKYRIKKKLALHENVDLIQYLQQL